MADLSEAFNNKIQSNLVTNQDSIDHFFTQRKITKHVEYLDHKDMTRKQKKNDVTLNFIAINVPYYEHISNDQPITIDMKVYGNENLKYYGSHEIKEGFFPSILLKLSSDKQLFVHLKFNKSGDQILEKEYVSFIDIPKRYQVEPSISDMGSELCEKNE